MMARGLKLRTKSGAAVDLPVKKIKNVLAKVGFTGRLLVSATGKTLQEAGKLANEGVVSVTNLQKAIVKAVASTNKLAMNTTQKVAKKVLLR